MLSGDELLFKTVECDSVKPQAEKQTADDKLLDHQPKQTGLLA